MTTGQILNRSKTVTRRLGWARLKPGELITAVEKAMGLKKGQKVKRLALLRIMDLRREPLCVIDQTDVAREGFPELTPEEFVTLFCRANKCQPNTLVNRIQFEYLETI